MFEYVLLKQSRSDFIERLFYLKRMYNIYLLDIVFIYWGVAKTKIITWKCSKPYSWFIHRLSSKFYLVDIIKSPTKSSKIPNLLPPNHLSYPISSNPTKIKHFPSFITQKSNPHPTKNLPTIPKSSLFIDTFTDNVFSPQKSPQSSLTTSPTQGVLKNYTQNHSNKRITI